MGSSWIQFEWFQSAPANYGGRILTITYLDTIFGEDRLPHYKVMASRFEVEG